MSEEPDNVPTPPGAFGSLDPERHPPIEDAEPVFVLGSVRSGTSAMVQALLRGAGLPGFHEGNLLGLMQRMLDQVEDYVGNFEADYLDRDDLHHIGRLDASALSTHVHNYFALMFARDMGSGMWVDKSPDSYLHAPQVRAAPRILQTFPKARFIFCARRGIENVLSRTKKFSEIPFGFHCRSWAHTLEEWAKVHATLGPERCLTVYQRDIAIKPSQVADSVSGFLGFDDHQREGMIRVFTGRRVEQTSAAREHRELPLDETPWSESQRAVFLRWCSVAMKGAGFTMEGESFSTDDVPVRLFFPEIEGAVDLIDCDAASGFEETDDAALQLHPNAPGAAPARVRYRDLYLDGQDEWSTGLLVAHAEAGPVRFSITIEDAATEQVVFEAVREVPRPESLTQWCEATPKLSGTYHVTIGTEMAPGAPSADHALARFVGPSLRRRGVGR